MENENITKEVMDRLMKQYKEKQEQPNVDETIKEMTFTLDKLQVSQMNAWIEKHNKSRKCSVNKRRREHRKKGIMPCGGECQYSLEITFASMANLASIKCECGEELYLGEV
jgi:hypothetical protein